MALMFPRLARNFVKNGYFPTDEPTLERALNALAPSDGPMCILDPCAGEGVAIAEAAHALGPLEGHRLAIDVPALTLALGSLIRSDVLTAYPYPARIWTPEVVAA